jgi:hypothetical protein
VQIAPANHSALIQGGPSIIPSAHLTFALIASPTQHMLKEQKVSHPNTNCTTISVHLFPVIKYIFKFCLVVIQTVLSRLLYPSKISISLHLPKYKFPFADLKLCYFYLNFRSFLKELHVVLT